MGFTARAWRDVSAYSPTAEGQYLEKFIGQKWNDIRFPAAAVNPPGAASDPDRDATDGTWLFDGGGTEKLFFQVQIPHGWVSGTDLKPHIHWCKTSSAAGDVVWKMRYRHAAPGQTFSAWSALDTATHPVPDLDTEDHHALSAFSAVALRMNPSGMLLVELSRVGGDGSDTYGADAKLLEFDIHYLADSAGTTNEFSD